MKSKFIGSSIKDTHTLYIRSDQDKEHNGTLARLVKILEDKLLSEFLVEIYKRKFKGKYYSNKYNYAQILTLLKIDGDVYIDLIKSLKKGGIIEEIDKRVYIISEDILIERI